MGTIRFSQILCPIDFSEFSRRAVDHAGAIARWHQATLTVLHVFPNLPLMDLPPIVLGQEDRERLEDQVRRFTAHLPGDISIERRIREAPDIHEEILGQAAAVHADLLVIGTHGRSGFERMLLGSVTEKVLRKAPCPTMVVPRAAHDAPPDRPVEFRRILCPVDFSEASIRALEYAVSMTADGPAQVLALHVIELPPELHEFPFSTASTVEGVRAAAEAACLRRLRDAIPGHVRSGCNVETSVREGAAYREIVKAATDHRSDLIVMGLRGRGALDRMVFGSNTARVARAATCPVLVVREP